MIFKKHSAQPGHIKNLAINLFEDMRYYNGVSSAFSHDSSTGTQVYFKKSSSADYHWRQPPDG